MRRFIGLTAIMAALCAVGAAVSAGALTIQEGVVPYQVLPCGADGTAAIAFKGAADGAGRVEARIAGMQKIVMGWTPVGEAVDGQWAGVLAGIPAGGPYRVDVRVMDAAGETLETASVLEVLAGDLWVLAGQSNMQGVGNRFDVEEPHPQVHVFSMSHEWRRAEEPLHILGESPDPVHCKAQNDEEREKAISGWRDGPKGAGLGISFAKEMARRTGRPVGLIASAHGGTSMAQWDPALRDQGGESLYGSMYKQVQAAGGVVRGVLWYQGESDANADAQPVFKEKFKALVAAMRRDFNAPEMPFYYVQIGRFVVEGSPADDWNKVQADQLAAESEMDRAGMVASIDLALDDLIHVGTPGLKTLGYRLANLAERDLFGGRVLAGPRVEVIERAETRYGMQVRVRCSGINGGLQAAGRVSGFSISAGPDGPEFPCIYKQEIAPEDPEVVVLWVNKLPENPHLWYGRGLDPYCNVVDAAKMALPVFGPVPIP